MATGEFNDLNPSTLLRASSAQRLNGWNCWNKCFTPNDPRPTVAVRLVSVLENAMTNEGQISYLKAYHRLGGWFPREAKDPASVR